MKQETPKPRRRVKYRQLPHTADMAWRVWGDSLPEVFENAAKALTSTMADLRYIRRRETREVAVESPDREALLVDWLNRLLYLFDVEAFLGREFSIISLSPRRLEARVTGEPYDPDRHREGTAVKAATYHHLEIVRRDGRWQATVVLDL